jgi:hypothetical protein
MQLRPAADMDMLLKTMMMHGMLWVSVRENMYALIEPQINQGRTKSEHILLN